MSAAISFTSPPAEKARPAPVRAKQRTASSAAQSRSASPSADSNSADIVFIRSGRLSVINATPSSPFSTRTGASGMTPPGATDGASTGP